MMWTLWPFGVAQLDMSIMVFPCTSGNDSGHGGNPLWIRGFECARPVDPSVPIRAGAQGLLSAQSCRCHESSLSMNEAPSGTHRSGLPLRHTAISMAPHRIAPVGAIAAAFDHQRFVDLYTQAGLAEWSNKAVVEPEVLRVQHIVEHFAAPVVVNAHALFMSRAVPTDIVD